MLEILYKVVLPLFIAFLLIYFDDSPPSLTSRQEQKIRVAKLEAWHRLWDRKFRRS